MQLHSTWGNDIALAQGESDILTFVFLSNWNKVKIFKLSWRETFQFRKANFSSQHMRLTSTGNRWNASLSFNVTHWVKLTPQRRHHFGSLFLPRSLWTQLFGRAPSPTMCSIFCFPFFVAPTGLSSDNRTVLPIWFKIFCDFVYIIMRWSTGFFPNSDHPGSSATNSCHLTEEPIFQYQRDSAVWTETSTIAGTWGVCLASSCHSNRACVSLKSCVPSASITWICWIA